MRVVLAMSGGVDSSVAAHLLTSAGHDVIGVFMRHGESSPVAECTLDGTPGGASMLPILNQRADHKQGCCSASDAADARRVADRMEIPFYALNLEREFGRIIDYFVQEYVDGRTPNPCVMCNNWIKFGKLFDYADSVGAEYVATGHYARLVGGENGGVPRLVRGVDPGKDQTYALFGIQQKYLSRMLLPVGDYYKHEIRAMAAETGLRVAEKKDSQEICFVTSGKHDQFIKARRDDLQTSGEFVTPDGTVLGRHDGIERFTIGQRKGLGIALGEPRYVTRIDPQTNQVTLGTKEQLGRTTLTANRCNWLARPPGETFACTAMIRYNSQALPATARLLPEDRLEVTFDDPTHGVAPGQAVVCYEGDQVLGGGWIE